VIARFYFSDGSHTERIPFGSVRGLSKKIGDNFERPIRVELHGEQSTDHNYNDWIKQCHAAVAESQLHSPLSAQQQFAKSLLTECDITDQGHTKWLSIMRFGMATLQQSQEFLMCLIVERAYQYAAYRDGGSLSIGEQAAKIADELGLELTEKRVKDGDA
jgi:hypothetical protein